MKLIFVHGRAQGDKEENALRAVWEGALEEGFRTAGLSRPADLEIALPFYGKTLDTLVEELEAPLVAQVAERGAAHDGKEAAFRGEFLEEIAQQRGLSDQKIAEFYDGEVQEKGVLNWKWVHAILKALDHHENLGREVLDRFTRDVYVYLSNPGVRARIDKIVADALPNEPSVVVGHSLGSIVAYNVLRRHPHRVVRYITLGSPLAVRAVKQRLERVEMPSSTGSWHNARDPNDVVSLYPLDADNFRTNPLIENHDAVDNRTDNQHGIVGYLPDPWVARRLHEALTRA